MGRHKKWKTPKELEPLIDDYFDTCDETKRPYTVTGLAYHLGTNRQTLCNYEKDAKFKYIIERAKLRCEMYAEECLYTRTNVAGVIFSLKNNWKWKDKHEQEIKQSHSFDSKTDSELDNIIDRLKKEINDSE